MESHPAERNRLLKLLETANIKLASVVTDIFGGSGGSRCRPSSGGARLAVCD